MKYDLVELDDRAKQYMVEKMDDGQLLLQAIHKRLSSCEGMVYSIWPENASLEGIYSFEEAPGWFLKITETEQRFIDCVSSHLSAGSDKIVVFGNECASRGDSWLARAKSHLLFCQDNAYHYLLAEHNEREMILVHMREAMMSWRGWVLFSSVPPGTALVDRGELDESLIEALAERAEKCALNVYDFDSYLIWDLQARSSAVGPHIL
jgi:hypothetical protein